MFRGAVCFVVLLAACTPMNPAQQGAAVKACTDAGLSVRVTYTEVVCKMP